MALIASWLLTVGRGAAMAATYCASASHCYTIVRLGVASLPYGFRGDYVLLHPRCLDIDSAAHFVTSETWLANFVGASGYWIEAGVAVGAPVQLGQPYFYWADDRPSHGYLEHDDSVNSPDLSQSYSIGIYPLGNYVTSTSFDVYVGPWYGTSTWWPQGYVFDHLDAGTETSTGGISHYLVSTRAMGLYSGNSGTLEFRSGWFYDGGQHTHTVSGVSTWNNVNTISADHHYAYYNETAC